MKRKEQDYIHLKFGKLKGTYLPNNPEEINPITGHLKLLYNEC
jgi:hypothetical protein